MPSAAVRSAEDASLVCLHRSCVTELQRAGVLADQVCASVHRAPTSSHVHAQVPVDPYTSLARATSDERMDTDAPNASARLLAVARQTEVCAGPLLCPSLTHALAKVHERPSAAQAALPGARAFCGGDKCRGPEAFDMPKPCVRR